jgi:putative SOS response-associated peptidase YedK
MCTRYVLLERHVREALARLGVATPARFESRYNIAPNTRIPIVRQAENSLECTEVRWGLLPSWARDDEGPPLVNARLETLFEKPSFRDSLRTRRCIIPATGFYEWETRGKAKLPWLFRRKDEQPFGFAGLWDTWRAPDGTLLESCAFVTTTPNALMRPIHERMPVMLATGEFATWLDPRLTEPNQLKPLLRTPADEDVGNLALGTYVSNVRNQGPMCLTPATEAPPDSEPQLSLGF